MSQEQNKNTRKAKRKLILNERFTTCQIYEAWDDTQRVRETQQWVRETQQWPNFNADI
jgi:hypothetical protein